MKKTITVILKVPELLYEMQDKTYLRGKALDDGTNYKTVANMQADEDNEDIIRRHLSGAFGILRNLLAENIVSDSTSVSNALNTSDEYRISLSMPSNYNQASNETIMHACHEYLVNAAISAWYLLTNKEEADTYSSLAAASVEAIREAINKRTRPTKIHL